MGELRTLNSDFVFLDTATGELLSATTFNPTDTPSITIIRMGDVDQDFDPTAINTAGVSAKAKPNTDTTDPTEIDSDVGDESETSVEGLD